MKKMVLINQSTGYLMIDIVNAYADRYDSVSLIAGSIKMTERSLKDIVKVDKIIAYNRESFLKRLFTWCWGTIQIFFKLLFKYRGYEIVYVTNPPMCYLLPLLLRRPFSVIVYDIYPDALRNIGVKENNWLYKQWAGWNRIIFSRALKVVTLSEGMGKVLEKYVNKDQIRVIPNWAASVKFRPIKKSDNRFIQRHSLDGKFIVLYSGNIGYTHNVECLIEVARLLKNEVDIRFLIIGEGKKKETLIKMTKEYGLSSCCFFTWQDRDTLPYSLAAADVGVVTLNDETAQVSVPSKTYNLLAVGAPLLCIAPKCSELAYLVSHYDNGTCFDKSEVFLMADYILTLKNNMELQKRLSDNSCNAAKDFTYQNAQNYV